MSPLKLVLHAPVRTWAGGTMVVSADTPTSQLRLVADILDALPAALTITATLLDGHQPVSTLEMPRQEVILNGARASLWVKNPPRLWDLLPMGSQKTTPYKVVLTVETL